MKLKIEFFFFVKLKFEIFENYLPFVTMLFSKAAKYIGNLSAAKAALAASFSFSSVIPIVFPMRLVMSVAVSMISSIFAAAKSSSLG